MDHREARKANFDALLARYERDIDFANATDIAPPIVSQIKTGERKLGDTLARRIEKQLKLNHGWMDHPHDNYIKEDRSAGYYGHTNTEAAPDFSKRLPLISLVTAGDWAEAVDNFHPGDAEEWLPAQPDMSERSFAVRVVGESMLPDYRPGDILCVDPELRGGTPNGALVIARMQGTHEVTFKQYIEDAGRRYLKPLNASFLPITDPFDILGVVKYATRKTY